MIGMYLIPQPRPTFTIMNCGKAQRRPTHGPRKGPVVTTGTSLHIHDGVFDYSASSGDEIATPIAAMGARKSLC